MTRVTVVDASVVACILFREAEAPAMMDALDGARLTAPSILWFEIGNVCITKCRRQPDSRELLLGALLHLGGMKVQEHPVDVSAVAELALLHRLSFYDASYLWLARHLSAELVTLDKALARAAAG